MDEVGHATFEEGTMDEPSHRNDAMSPSWSGPASDAGTDHRSGALTSRQAIVKYDLSLHPRFELCIEPLVECLVFGFVGQLIGRLTSLDFRSHGLANGNQPRRLPNLALAHGFCLWLGPAPLEFCERSEDAIFLAILGGPNGKSPPSELFLEAIGSRLVEAHDLRT